MKFIIIVSLVLISSVCFGQAKDSTKHKEDSVAVQKQQLEATVQAINYVLADMKSILYGKIKEEEYSMLIKIQDEYIKQKNEQLSPAAKKK